MKHILLLGAGFSQNWGGWVSKEVFEYLLEKKEIHDNPRLLSLLWSNQEHGFESMLATLHNNYQIHQNEQTLSDLNTVEKILRAMFKDMNNGFNRILDWEINLNLTHHFLTRFDAIFTLNQDLLLEYHYLNNNIQLRSHGSKKWGGYQIPGMVSLTPNARTPGETFFSPASNSDFFIEKNLQPYIKLHGSSNWTSKDEKNLLIMGSNKATQIAKFEILKHYYNYFESCLNDNCKLMVVGYGFLDNHINQSLLKAAENNLKLFNVNPLGSDQALQLNKTKNPSQIGADTDVELLFKKSLIGASRKPLRETFSNVSSAEFNKFSRFFE